MKEQVNKFLSIMIPLLSGVSLSSLCFTDNNHWKWALPLAIFCCGLKFIFVEAKIK